MIVRKKVKNYACEKNSQNVHGKNLVFCETTNEKNREFRKNISEKDCDFHKTIEERNHEFPETMKERNRVFREMVVKNMVFRVTIMEKQNREFRKIM